jgi:nucleoside-triphosphatase THEP1
MSKSGLSEKWIKASIIGTIWAASEIVLGSFLHNLRIPFSGNILTAIGIIILISMSYTWTERGLFWRAGLICAIMKTMSPSAVIFGPMIAIFSESLLLEISVSLSGRTIAGYMIGSMLAMSWNLFQKIANLIIFYGSGIIDVYTDLLKMAQKQLGIQTDLVWLPIIILLIVYALFGLFAATIGIRVGRKILNSPASVSPVVSVSKNEARLPAPKKRFDYSLPWLFVNIFLIIGSFLLLTYASWPVWGITIISIVIVWALRYKSALRQLSKPKFWIIFVFITLITAFVFTKAETGADLLKKGLLTGFQMNFRAVMIIVGFSVLGTELYNPRIRNFFMRTSFKHLPLALELSTESLPAFIAGIPDFKSLIRNPVSIFYQVISHADERLQEIKNSGRLKQKVFIISGAKGEGKTTFCGNLAHELKRNGIQVSGFLSQKVISDNQIVGYDLIDLDTNVKEVFLRHDGDADLARIGKFSIYPEGIEMGRAILDPSNLSGKRIIIIDEVGQLELDDKGWAVQVMKLSETTDRCLILTVRDNFTGDVVEKFKLQEPVICKISEIDYLAVSRLIIAKINS